MKNFIHRQHPLINEMCYSSFRANGLGKMTAPSLQTQALFSCSYIVCTLKVTAKALMGLDGALYEGSGNRVGFIAPLSDCRAQDKPQDVFSLSCSVSPVVPWQQYSPHMLVSLLVSRVVLLDLCQLHYFLRCHFVSKPATGEWAWVLPGFCPESRCGALTAQCMWGVWVGHRYPGGAPHPRGAGWRLT